MSAPREDGLRVIVGLGNPGPRYAATRHNAGFWFIDALAARHGGHWRAESRFGGELARIEIEGRGLWLLKPMAFMNRSGQPIARLAAFYRVSRPQILVAHDDLDLLPGVVRLKRDGGHGGHNGLRDAVQHLGGNDFMRLRFGIGHPGDSSDVVEYVLRKAPPAEQEQIEQAVAAAVEALPTVAAGDLERAMHALHSR